MKHVIITIALLLMPISAIYAQENKHAQAMHTAFRETLDRRAPKYISSTWIPGSKDSLSIIYTALDGGGLVPKNKIHVVQLGKNRADIGPNYLDGWSFEFRNVPDDPNLPLRQILDAYDKQSPQASSYYSYVAGDEQAVFPGVSIAYGESGETLPLQLHPSMNVRIIGFKDDDGFRSTYLLSWASYEEDEPLDRKHKYYMTRGIMYEFHCPKLKSTPQIKSYDDEEYLDRSNTALSVAQNMLFEMRKKEPERAKALDTDTLAEVFQYNFIKMAQQLYDEPKTYNLKTSYEALHAKLWLMTGIGSTATLTEQKAICYTLNKEVESYPYLFSQHHADELMNMTRDIIKDLPDDLKKQANMAQATINAHRNLTAGIDSLSDNDQDYLNRNHWTLIHQPVKYHHEDMFTARGEHYSADQQTGYLHVNRENYGSSLRIENTLKNLRPGRYRVSAVVRAKKTNSGHSGLLVFAQVGDQTVRKEIPADGDAGGNVWFSALNRFSRKANAHEGVLALDLNKASAHGGQGGALNSAECSKWFSACDFIVEKVDK